MIIDNSKLLFSSEWDIDQLIYQNEIDNLVIPGNTTSLSFITLQSFNFSYPPVVDATMQLVGDSVWRQLGDNSLVTLLQLPLFIVSTPTGISLGYYNFNSTNTIINVRYYVWTDKINY